MPLCVTALTDYDVKEEDGIEVLENLALLYKESRDEKKVFSAVDFIIVVIKGMIISFIMFFFCIQNISLNKKGNISDLWYLSLLYYLSILLVVTNHLFFITQYIVIILPLVVLITTFLLLAVFLLMVHYGLLFEFKSKASIFPSLENISFYLYLLFLIGFNFTIDFCIKLKGFYMNKGISSELERIRVENENKKILKNKMLKTTKTKKVRRSASNTVEQSRLTLINNNFRNIANDYNKISYLNKNNLSKISDFKMSHMKRVSESIYKIRKEYKKKIKNESEDEKE